MIVQIAGFQQCRDKGVDAGNTGCAPRNVGWQIIGVVTGDKAGFISLDIHPDGIRAGDVKPLPIVTPGQFLNEFFRLLRRCHGVKRVITHLIQCQHPMPDIGGQPGNSAIKMVAGGGILLWIDCRKKRQRCRPATNDRAWLSRRREV